MKKDLARIYKALAIGLYYIDQAKLHNCERWPWEYAPLKKRLTYFHKARNILSAKGLKP